MKVISHEARTYDGVDYKFPVLDYEGVSYCRGCGRCCWDWKGDRKEEDRQKERCEHLSGDMERCLVYDTDKMACGGLNDNWPQPYHFVDLPLDCGYVIFWKEQRLI